jgi:hypothetical protein
MESKLTHRMDELELNRIQLLEKICLALAIMTFILIILVVKLHSRKPSIDSELTLEKQREEQLRTLKANKKSEKKRKYLEKQNQTRRSSIPYIANANSPTMVLSKPSLGKDKPPPYQL